MTVERMVWTGTCDECGTVYGLWPSEEQSKGEQEAISKEWPEEGDCMVQDCAGSVTWNGNDLLRDVLAPRML